MDNYFQNDKNEEYKDIEEEEEEEDTERGEEIGEIENNKKNKIDKSQINNPNIINNNRNYHNSIRQNKLNQSQKVNNNPNSMNLNYKNLIQNNNNFPYLTQRINESQNFYSNRKPNLNFNNNLVFNDNQSYNQNQNQMFTPNYNNFAQLIQYPNISLQFNNFSPYNPNINNNFPQFNNFSPYIPNINNNYPQFNNFNPYNTNINNNNLNNQNIIELVQKVNQLLDNNQQAFTHFNENNEEQEDETKYKEKIDIIYQRNLGKANETLQNKKKGFLKENLENKEIIIYITNNKTNEFIGKLNEIKAIIFSDLKIPKITYKMIEQKIKNTKYKITEEDNILLKDYENNYNLKDKLYFNKYMFYSKIKISLFTPHIIRTSKNIMSLFLPEKLNLSDFQYKDYHKKINNDIFLNLLQLRINQFNDYEKKDGNITDKRYNEKIFGFNKNKSGKKFYLYSIMDEKIISEKIKMVNINSLFENLTAAESQIDMSKKQNTLNGYELFNKNMNFLKGLSYEELILYIILNKIGDNYEIFPRILFYEYYLTINGEKVVVSNKIRPGYSEVDYAFYSKCDYIYKEEPLIVQKKYKYNIIYNNLSFSNENLEIKDNTLYFIELKSSFNFSGIENEQKRILEYKDYFTKLFNKYKEFIHLYESKNWIKKDTKREILFIYDNDIIEISSEIEDIINNLLKENPDCTFKIIYTLKSYPYFSHSVAIRNHNQLTEKYEKLKKREEELSKTIEEILKEKKEILKENKEIKEKLDNLYKKFEAYINNKVENNEKKNEVSQNDESQNKEIKNNLINNNKIENSEVSNWGHNNNETKMDEN